MNTVVLWKCVDPMMGCGISSTVDNMNEEISAISHRNGKVSAIDLLTGNQRPDDTLLTYFQGQPTYMCLVLYNLTPVTN